MSLLNRKLPPLGRVARQERDDRIVVVATEDTYAPEQYFNGLHFDRVRVLVLPTQDNKSSPEHVVDRLCKAFSNARLLKEDQDDDAFWVLIDTDHHFQRNHCGGTVQALDEARRRGFGIAVSNPCFEVWLLLHQESLGVGDAFANAKAVEDRLRAVLGRYDKTRIDMRQFSLPQLKIAIQRARALESRPDDPIGYDAPNPGTRVYRLMEHILGHSSGGAG